MNWSSGSECDFYSRAYRKTRDHLERVRLNLGRVGQDRLVNFVGQASRPCHLHGSCFISTPASWSWGSQGSRSASLRFRLFRGDTCTWETGCGSEGQRACGGRFLFLCNQREAASFSIHSTSSFTLKPYLAWRLRKSRLKSKRLLMNI